MRDYPVISANGHLADNPIWNIPAAPVNEVRGNMKHFGPWQIPVSYRALAVDMHGRVFGMRTMSKPRESGYDLEGQVSIEGRKYRAFTSSKLFTRADGTLCDVAINYVCGTPDMKYADPLTVPIESRREYLKALQSRYHYEREGLYAHLREYCRAIEMIGWEVKDNDWLLAEYTEQAKQARAELLAPMGWEN